jgi:prevent-host-death family protein
MKKVALSQVEEDLSEYLRIAEKQDVIITGHGKPAGVRVQISSALSVRARTFIEPVMRSF